MATDGYDNGTDGSNSQKRYDSCLAGKDGHAAVNAYDGYDGSYDGMLAMMPMIVMIVVMLAMMVVMLAN